MVIRLSDLRPIMCFLVITAIALYCIVPSADQFRGNCAAKRKSKQSVQPAAKVLLYILLNLTGRIRY